MLLNSATRLPQGRYISIFRRPLPLLFFSLILGKYAVLLIPVLFVLIGLCPWHLKARHKMYYNNEGSHPVLIWFAWRLMKPPVTELRRLNCIKRHGVMLITLPLRNLRPSLLELWAQAKTSNGPWGSGSTLFVLWGSPCCWAAHFLSHESAA